MSKNDDLFEGAEVLVDSEGVDKAPVKDKEIQGEDLQAALDAARLEIAKAKETETNLQRRASTAERERDAARQDHGNEVENRVAAERKAIETSITASQAEADRLSAEATVALDEGRNADAIKLNREIGKLESRIETLSNHKLQLDRFETDNKKRTEDPLSAWDGMPKTQAWIKEHPLFLSDTEYHSKAMSAHYGAIAKKFATESPEYFDFINKALAEEQEEVEEEEEEVEIQPKRQAQRVSAPVTRRSTTSPANARQTVVRLTPEEAESADATMSEIADPKERYLKYYQNKQKLIESGRLGRVN